MWLWVSGSDAARLARAALAPAALAWDLGRRGHAALYRVGGRAGRRLPLPSVGVGSLQVGGAGKTPVASWIASWLADRGYRPAVLLRGYGGDEGPLHRLLEPRAVVVENPSRSRGAVDARDAGADTLVLDDHAQHLGAVPDRSLLLIGVEALLGPRQLLPAGPWRQPWTTGRADVLVLTAKSASAAACARARRAVEAAYPERPIAEARLTIAGWDALNGRTRTAGDALRGRTVYAVCGIADPRPFLAQAGASAALAGAAVRRDHAAYGPRHCARIARAAESARVDYVVTTAKDAVKLRSAWPAGAPPVLVARLALRWTAGEGHVTGTLAACFGPRGERIGTH